MGAVSDVRALVAFASGSMADLLQIVNPFQRIFGSGAGLPPHTEVERIVRAEAGNKAGRGARLVAHLRGRGDVAMGNGPNYVVALPFGD